MITGTFECKIDTKGRLMLPSSLKKQLSSVLQDGFVMKRSIFDKCVELIPMAEWEKTMQDIGSLNMFQRQNVDFVRKYTAGVKEVEIDTTGRLLIPKDLVVYASITKEVVLTSRVNIVEIWDKDLYEQSISMDPDDFAALAEQVMNRTRE